MVNVIYFLLISILANKTKYMCGLHHISKIKYVLSYPFMIYKQTISLKKFKSAIL